MVFPTPVSPTRRRTGSMLVTENTEWRGGKEGGADDRGTNTLTTWRPDDLREMAGLWTVIFL
jgi:hypothetical protein